jgi:tetratricopeptide (TPR) repeat protein
MTQSQWKKKTLLVLFSLCFAIILLEVGLRLTGNFLLFLRDADNNQKSSAKPYTIVCLGESTTMLGGVDAYPRQLETLLNQSHIKNFKVINKGRPGEDSAYILSELDSILEDYNPDMVISMMGINDDASTRAYKSTMQNHFASFIKDFRIVKLVKLIRQHLKAKFDESSEEDKLKVSLNTNPKDIWSYKVLGEYYEHANEPEKAKDLYRRGKQKFPKKAFSYEMLGRLMYKENRFQEVESLYEEAIAKNDQKTWPYVLLAQFYERQNQCTKAIDLLKKAQTIVSTPREIFLELGMAYKLNNEVSRARDIFEDVINRGDADVGVYSELGYIYYEDNQKEKAKAMFEKGFFLDNKRGQFVIDWLIEKKDFVFTEDFLMGLRIKASDPAQVDKALGTLYERWGKNEEAAKFYKQSDEARPEYYNHATKVNYLALAKKVLDKKIKLVCVQYAMRPVEPLKKLMQDQQGISFVDNEYNFKDALKNASYNDYFTDSFAGDFGHCTKKGNALLAENIAKTVFEILKDERNAHEIP